MIVDDHAAFRQMVKTVLVGLAAEVVECADGQEAVERYSQTQPDIVLMDIAMKGLDGLGASRQIKSRFPKARILILTQYDDPELRKAACEAGACEYVLKDDLLRLQELLCARTEPQP